MSISHVITQALSDTVARPGFVRIAFPGGRSAVELMSELSKASIDWQSVCVTLVDERAVNESSDASNAALVKSTLCVNQAEQSTFEPLCSFCLQLIPFYFFKENQTVYSFRSLTIVLKIYYILVNIALITCLLKKKILTLVY